MIVNPIEVKAVGNRSIWIRFADGTSGNVDLSHLWGKGVFKKWETVVPFKNVFVNPENHSIAWDSELELDSDNLYLELIHKTFEQVKIEEVQKYS